jgi:hypothetical protein
LRDAMRERRGLARARSRNDEQRSVTFVEDGGLLLRIERGVDLLHLSI